MAATHPLFFHLCSSGLTACISRLKEKLKNCAEGGGVREAGKNDNLFFYIFLSKLITSCAYKAPFTTQIKTQGGLTLICRKQQVPLLVTC